MADTTPKTLSTPQAVPPPPPPPPAPDAMPAAVPTEAATSNVAPATDAPIDDGAVHIQIDADGRQEGEGVKARITLDGKDVHPAEELSALRNDIHESLGNLEDTPLPETVLAGTIGAAAIVFVVFVLPIWLLLHYRSRRKSTPPVNALALGARPMSANEFEVLQQKALRMETRLDALESLMDAERPDWRR